ncbi:MAG: SDR family oxidoreductase [Spirochaetia bacterium]|nr:SDR family oxidoreductase [Spirochaetia bacterium]
MRKTWDLVYITGGSSGIGYAIAQQVLSEGSAVVLFARDQQRLSQAAAQLCSAADEARVHTMTMDVASQNDVLRRTAEAIRLYGAPDLLINCAGMAHPDHFFKLPFEVFTQTITINLLGTAAVTHALIPHMRDGSHIVNVSSVAGFIGTYGYTAYSSSKFGIIGFSQALRNELKPEGIGVSVLCPPDTQTPQLEKENTTKPPETFAISGNASLLQADQVAAACMSGLRRGRFLIIPGSSGKMIYLLNQLFPSLVRMLMDRIVRRSRRQEGITRRFVPAKGDQAPR